MSLTTFLNSKRVIEKNGKYTHTGLDINLGKYNIDENNKDLFYKLYIKELAEGNPVCLTETHEENGPILIDIDFRFPLDSGLKRKYTQDDILKVIRIYNNYIREYIDVNEEKIQAFCFEKQAPSKVNGNIKDGIHIMYPYIICNADIQFILRESVIKSSGGIFEELGIKNDINDVFDEAVISRNNWLMYGSGKDRSSYRYKLSHIYNNNLNSLELIEDNKLPKLLSIQGYKKANVKYKIELKKPIKEQQKIIIPKVASSADIEAVKKLLDIISKERVNKYNEWIEVGFCLHNIDTSLLGLWIEWSKKSEKFKEGECENYWCKFKNEGLTIASLYRWAKLDNPIEYSKYKRTQLSSALTDSLSGTNVDVANLVYQMYKYDFICASLRHHIWYQFKDHRWHEIDKGVSLRQNISIRLANEYINLSSFYKTKMIEAPKNQIEQIKQKVERCDILLKLVKTTSFKDKVMIECEELFYDPKFFVKLDSNRHLLGFENGVYDLNRLQFRDGLPDDYISYSTGIDYIDTKYNQKSIFQILEQILPGNDERNYVLKLASSFLCGRTGDQKFHIWTGSGANGKSTIVELLELIFGDYSSKLPITVMTQKRAGSSSANPEIAKTKGKRFVSFQEPEEGDKINVGYMKELSGGDKIMARALYKEPVEFKPQFKMILCCNNLPDIKSNDGGTWRRLRVVDFPSKFVDNPVESNEYKKDPTIVEKLMSWKEDFMAILIDYYKKYKIEGLKEPDTVIKYTREYQMKSDILLEYIDENIEVSDDSKDVLTPVQIYHNCKDWYKETLSDKPPKKQDIIAYFISKFGKESNGKSKGWKCMKFKFLV